MCDSPALVFIPYFFALYASLRRTMWSGSLRARSCRRWATRNSSLTELLALVSQVAETEGLLIPFAISSRFRSLRRTLLIPSWAFCTNCVSGGDGGIRTLGTLLRFASLAKKYFRPLSHVSEAWKENSIRACFKDQSKITWKNHFLLSGELMAYEWWYLLPFKIEMPR